MNPNRLKSVGIGIRLGGAFAALALLLLLCVVFGVQRLNSLNTSIRSLLEHEARTSVLAAGLVGQAYEASGALGRAVMADTGEEIQNALNQTAKAATAHASTKKSLAEALDKDAARAALKKVDAAEAAYRAGLDKVVAAIKSGDMDAARTALNNKAQLGSEAAYMAELKVFDAQQLGAMNDAKAEADAAYATGRNLLVGVALAAVALAAGLGVWITRGLLKQLGGEPEYAAGVTQRLAAGDLSCGIALKHDDQSSLLHGIESMRANFDGIVGRVRQTAECVATAAGEIAAGNSDLSTRTENQAGALEETATAMEGLSATVKQNADNARSANELAQTASGVAAKGGEIVARVVDTMKGIDASSKQIADIISVIDGIAFQTNILALNASVEAARAGEQGRGFAVVASEVRNLAGRSAEAAREIKTLINASVERVGQGSALVNEAGATMTEVVNSIRHVTDIMAEISAASVEQSRGVAQVDEALTQMEQATRQNAALVEEMAAAAASMTIQARELVSKVAVFKVSQVGGTLHGGAPRRRMDGRLAAVPASRQLSSGSPKSGPAGIAVSTPMRPQRER